MNKDKISVALSKKLIKIIEEEAKRLGISRSSRIEMILREHYNKTFEEEKEPRLRAAL